MNRQQLVQELSYQANALGTLEQLVVDHENNVQYYKDEKRGLSWQTLKKIFIGIAVATLIIGTILRWNLIALFVLIAVIFLIGYFSVLIAKHHNGNKDLELEKSSYKQNYQNALAALDNHPRFDLPEGRYYSYYLAKLSEMIRTGQANSLGEAVNTLENRLTQIESAAQISNSIDQTTAAVNNLNATVASSANAVIKAINAATDAANFNARVNAANGVMSSIHFSNIEKGLGRLNRNY